MKIRSRQGQLESRIENSYLEIGRKIYCRYRNGEAFDEQTAGLCQEILHMEKEIGSVAVGKRADYAVLNENFDVLCTVRNGKIIYKRR